MPGVKLPEPDSDEEEDTTPLPAGVSSLLRLAALSIFQGSHWSGSSMCQVYEWSEVSAVFSICFRVREVQAMSFAAASNWEARVNDINMHVRPLSLSAPLYTPELLAVT